MNIIKSTINNYKEKIRFNNLYDSDFSLFFLCKVEPLLNDYLLEQVVNLVTNDYNLSLIFVNEDCIVYSDGTGAAGLYSYFVNDTKRECYCKIKLNNINYSTTQKLLSNENYPCIFIANIESKAFTLLHELGHHIINLNGLEQSEELADAYIRIIVEEKLEPLMKYIYYISLDAYSNIKKPLNITSKEIYLNYYLPFLALHPELNLPKI